MWTILTIIAVFGLVLFWKGPNAVWGTLSFGLIGGIITAGIYAYLGHGFLWLTIGKWMVVSALIGFVAEIAHQIYDRIAD